MTRTPQIVLCSLPLLSTLAGQLLSSRVLEPRGQVAHEAYLVRTRATQLDLLRELRPDGRRWLLEGMIAELARAGAPEPGLLKALRSCLARAGEGACQDALGRSRALAWRARKQLWWTTGLRVGVKALIGIVFAVCGGLLARAAWRHRRTAVGVALLGVGVGLGGVARDIQRAIASSDRSWREGQRDFWITRARVALRLPAGPRKKRLRQVVEALEKLGAEPGALRRLSGTVAQCDGQATCRRVLVDLARIYSRWPGPEARRWLDRWLLWLGGALLLLVPAATLARRS